MRKQAQDEVNARGSGPDLAELERQGIQAMCSALGVTMHEINPDGHWWVTSLTILRSVVPLTLSTVLPQFVRSSRRSA